MFGKEKNTSLEVFNDIDSNLINLYRCVKYHPQEFQKELNTMLISREQFFDCRNQLQINGLTDIQRAARYFYIIKISFGNNKRDFNTSAKKGIYKSIENFPEIQKRLKNVNIENKDFENLIKLYDRPKALFYLDPPYFGAEKFYKILNNKDNANYFSKEDHIRLFEVLKKIKGKFILSYNNDEFIRNIYKNYKITYVERLNNLNFNDKKTNYKEIIVTNY